MKDVSRMVAIIFPRKYNAPPPGTLPNEVDVISLLLKVQLVMFIIAWLLLVPQEPELPNK